MKTLNSRLSVIFVLAALSACGDRDAEQLPGALSPNALEYSAEHKEAAQALSVGARAVASAGETRYEQALACSVALAAVTEQFGSGSLASGEQLDAFRQVRDMYADRARLFGQESGKSVQDVALDQDKLEAEAAGVREQSQIAIGCLRNIRE